MTDLTCHALAKTVMPSNILCSCIQTKFSLFACPSLGVFSLDLGRSPGAAPFFVPEPCIDDCAESLLCLRDEGL